MNWPQVLRLTRTVPLRFRWRRCHPSGALGAVRVGICVRLDELFLLLARFSLSVNKETGSSVSHVWDNWVSSLIILIWFPLRFSSEAITHLLQVLAITVDNTGCAICWAFWPHRCLPQLRVSQFWQIMLCVKTSRVGVKYMDIQFCFRFYGGFLFAFLCYLTLRVRIWELLFSFFGSYFQ